MSHQTNSVRALSRLALLLPLLLCFSLIPGRDVHAQVGPPSQDRTPQEIEWEAQQKRAAQKAENAKRQQEIKKDTDKLLELATELKQYVDKTDEHTLSIDVIKKAEEIEKLAHTVKDKMKGS